ncbi:MAG TPA: radical SAM protein, partial [Ruminococcus sp.]|nr:radical SAM protein [Ruminococcus sp.]
MAHKNISVFIPHAGCPNMCSFCNQNKISGAEKAPSADEVYSICRNQFENMPDRSNTEIAFFGGSFTAIPYDYMISLLECVQPFICENGFDGIRI